MSRKSLCIFAIVMTFTILTARADYRELKKDFDTYGPSPYFQEQVRSAPHSVDRSVDSEFSVEKSRIEGIKSRWEKLLSESGGKTMFLVTNKELLKSLKPAEKDADDAAEALKGTFSLDTIEVLTLLRNPGIKAAKDRLQGTVEAFTQVIALDEILREYTAFTEGIMPGVGPMKGKEPMQVKFPFPGVMSLKGEIVNQEVIAERESLEIVRRDAVTAVRKAYWNLAYVIKARQITTEMLELLKQLDEVAQARYEAGTTSYQDVIKVRIKQKTLHEDLVTLKEQQLNLESRIREILDLSPGIHLGKPESIKISGKIPALKNLYGLARQRRQELLRIRARVGKMERMIEMAETMILPPYTLNLSLYEDEAVNQVGSTAKKETFPMTTEISRGAGLPKKPLYGIEDAYLRETRQKLLALREDLKTAEATTDRMVRDAWFELDLAQREGVLYDDDVVQLSKSALDVSTRGYVAGSVNFADVIDSYTTWLRANLALERKRSNFGIAWAELERVVGTSLR